MHEIDTLIAWIEHMERGRSLSNLIWEMHCQRIQ